MECTTQSEPASARQFVVQCHQSNHKRRLNESCVVECSVCIGVQLCGGIPAKRKQRVAQRDSKIETAIATEERAAVKIQSTFRMMRSSDVVRCFVPTICPCICTH